MDSCKSCGVEKALKVIGSKWTLLLIHQLCSGKKRFGELHRSLEMVSTKTLTERLRTLEKCNILVREVVSKKPLQVEYSLTEKGMSLKKIVNQLNEWGEELS